MSAMAVGVRVVFRQITAVTVFDFTDQRPVSVCLAALYGLPIHLVISFSI